MVTTMQTLLPLLTIMGILLQTPIILCKACDTPGDIVFALDGSESISDEDWTRHKNFIVNLIDGFEIKSDAIHVGIVVYSTRIGDKLRLQYKKETLKTLTKKLNHSKMGTNTALGIEAAHDILKQGRPNVPKSIIVITDGKSTVLRDTINQANRAKAKDITIIAIGVGSDINREELSQIVSEPDLLLTVQDAGQLLSKVDVTRNIICKSLGKKDEAKPEQEVGQRSPSDGTNM